MKNMRKLFAMVLAVIMVMSLATTAFAAETTNGKITISDAVAGQTYTIYQILDLESYNADTKAYAYKANDAWTTFINGTGVKDVYVNVDDQGYVTWVENASAAEFAKLAQAYAKGNSIANQGEKIAESTTVVFEDLDLGYYLVDTTLGALCSLNTTDPEAIIEEKNEAPEIAKEVQEDSDSSWGETNDADMKQVVNYKATVTVKAGAENYVVYDKMSEGLTFNDDVKVYVNDEEVDSSNYTVTKDVTVGTGDDAVTYTFAVVFKNEYIATLPANTKIVITYSATVNDKAVVGLPGNPNEVILKYGDETKPSWTPKDETITYTWDMEVLKYANGKETDVLAGVKFVLLNNDKTKVATVVDGKLTGWVAVPTADDAGNITWPENTTLTTDASGKISIDGLDADTYYLREIEALPGYNKLANDVEVIVTGATTPEGSTTLTYTTVVAKVNNQSGTELPETGGVGTTMFYVIGGVLMLAAVVLLVTKKRMASAE